MPDEGAHGSLVCSRKGAQEDMGMEMRQRKRMGGTGGLGELEEERRIWRVSWFTHLIGSAL